jgi:hypothetical protein
MNTYNSDLAGTHVRSDHIPDTHPGMTMAEAFRAFPTAVRLDRETGDLIPIHPSAQEAAKIAVKNLGRSGEYSNFDINALPVPPSNGEHRAADARTPRALWR